MDNKDIVHFLVHAAQRIEARSQRTQGHIRDAKQALVHAETELAELDMFRAQIMIVAQTLDRRDDFDLDTINAAGGDDDTSEIDLDFFYKAEKAAQIEAAVDTYRAAVARLATTEVGKKS